MELLRHRYEQVQAVENLQLGNLRPTYEKEYKQMQKNFRRYNITNMKKLKRMRVKPKDTCVQSMFTPAHSRAKFVSLLHMKMSKVSRWFVKVCQLLNIDQQQYIVDSKELRSRPHNIRVCLRCNVHRTVNKEKATAACESCGSCCSFASHIFEIREDKFGTISTDIRSNNKSEYIDQYETNFGSINLRLLDVFRDAYSRFIHVRDVGKVTSTRTKKFIKRLKLPKYLYNCLERLNRELRGDPIPEFDASDIQLIVDQQDDLKRSAMNMLNHSNMLIESTEVDDNPEDDECMMGNNLGTKKTQQIQVTTRALALSNGLTQANLLVLHKNNDVHFGNARKLAADFEQQRNKPHQRSNYRGTRVPTWNMW